MIIDDNFIPEDIQDFALDLVTRKNIAWSFHQATNSYDDGTFAVINNENTEDHMQFVHFLRKDNMIFGQQDNFSLYDFLHDAIFIPFLQKHNIVCNSFHRMKLNLVTSYKDGIHQPAHIDQNIPHKVFLYYFNDSDGDTIMYNEKWDGTSKKLTENIRVQPKKGKAIFFDGLTYHAPSNPVNSNYRIVMNVDFV